MVAQQILVLFVKVRVLMRQLRRGARAPLFAYIPVAWDLTFFLILRENVGLGYDFDSVYRIKGEIMHQVGRLYENIG